MEASSAHYYKAVGSVGASDTDDADDNHGGRDGVANVDAQNANPSDNSHDGQVADQIHYAQK